VDRGREVWPTGFEQRVLAHRFEQRAMSARGRRYAKIVQLYQSRTNRSSAAAKAFLSLHFLFQDLTQYQE